MPNKEGMIIQGKLEHYNGDKVKRDKKLTDTINMLSLISDSGGQQIMNLISMSKLADRTWEAEHTDGGHTSHNEQNN